MLGIKEYIYIDLGRKEHTSQHVTNSRNALA
jgi:hypothetical protein